MLGGRENMPEPVAGLFVDGGDAKRVAGEEQTGTLGDPNEETADGSGDRGGTAGFCDQLKAEQKRGTESLEGDKGLREREFQDRGYCRGGRRIRSASCRWRVLDTGPEAAPEDSPEDGACQDKEA